MEYVVGKNGQKIAVWREGYSVFVLLERWPWRVAIDLHREDGLAACQIENYHPVIRGECA
jgi:hypothetical protein